MSVPEPDSNGVRWYGGGVGIRKPRPGNKDLCAEEITTYNMNWPSWHQCSRRKGHGKDGLLCKQHAKKEAENERYRELTRGVPLDNA